MQQIRCQSDSETYSNTAYKSEVHERDCQPIDLDPSPQGHIKEPSRQQYFRVVCDM